jgi:hypothetical protein
VKFQILAPYALKFVPQNWTQEELVKNSYCEPGAWHEWSNLFPLLAAQELAALSQDIRAHGLQNEIVLFDGKVLDGRNRLLACKIAGVRPRFREFKPNGISPLSWVISQNLHRRQLTPSQKAIIALEAEPMFARELKDNQRMGKQKIVDPHLKGQARDKAAQLAGVNRQYVSDGPRTPHLLQFSASPHTWEHLSALPRQKGKFPDRC